MDSTLATTLYDAAVNSPGDWYMQGIELRAAADRLDPETAPARDDEDTVSFASVYYLLAGLAFECLLKGQITLIGVSQSENPPMQSFTHNLRVLAGNAHCSAFAFTAAEIDALDKLSQYIEWAGRYPYPKRATQMQAKDSNSRERKELKILWDRMCAILRGSAYIQKAGAAGADGPKLFLKNI